jgi:putative endonuclease
MSEWILYLVRTSNGDLYTGISTDVGRRFAEHQAGGKKAARYLRGKGPLELVFNQKVGDRSSALKAETAVKKLTKAAKEKLLNGDIHLEDVVA